MKHLSFRNNWLDLQTQKTQLKEEQELHYNQFLSLGKQIEDINKQIKKLDKQKKEAYARHNGFLGHMKTAAQNLAEQQ